MNNSEVKSKIENMFKLDNNFEFVFIDGDGDSPDIFAIKFSGDTYFEGYKCQINVSLNFSSGFWDVNVNGFNTLSKADNEIELAFAIMQQTKFARTPCADQVLANAEASDVSFY